MGHIGTEQIFASALKLKIPSAVLHDIKTGEDVLIFRKKKNSWICPYKVNRTEDKMAYTMDGEASQPFIETKIFLTLQTNET